MDLANLIKLVDHSEITTCWRLASSASFKSGTFGTCKSSEATNSTKVNILRELSELSVRIQK